MMLAHIPKISGSYSVSPIHNFALISTSQNTDLLMNGSNILIKGDIHTNNDFLFRGSKLNIEGICEASGVVDARGAKINIDDIHENSPVIELPGFTDDIRKKATVAGSEYDTYNSDKHFNGSILTIQNTIIVNGNTTVNGSRVTARVISKTVPNIGTIKFEYDIINGVKAGETAEKAIDPKGNITFKVYDKAGRLKEVIDSNSTSSGDKTTYEYYSNGNRKSVIYPNGIKEEYTYYPDNTLRSLTNKYADGTIMNEYT